MFNGSEVAANSGDKRITPGNRVKLRCENIDLDQAKGNISMKFRGECGGVLNYTIFNIDPSASVYASLSGEDKKERIKKDFQKVLHVFAAFVGPDAVKAVKGESFPQVAMQLIKLVGLKYKEVQLEGKVVVNKKNFASFPFFPNFLSSDLNPTNWTINDTYDKFKYEDAPATDSPFASKEEESPFGGPISEDEIGF